MKKRFLFIFLLLPLLVPAQIIVEQGLGFMFLKQNGFVYRNAEPLPAFPEKIKVSRALAPFGGTFNVFIPFKMVSANESRYKFGVQTGLGFYYTRRKKSLDLNYVPAEGKHFFARTFGILHVPLLVAFKMGSALDPQKGRAGISIAAGLDAFYLDIPDEKAFALLPTSNFTFSKGKNGIRAGFYHMKFRSVFNSNAGEITRVKTAFFQLEVFHSF
jgi:hypothetical protein